MRYLCIDPATNLTGFAVYDSDLNRVVGHHSVYMTQGISAVNRVEQLKAVIVGYCQGQNIGEIYHENLLQFFGPNTYQTILARAGLIWKINEAAQILNAKVTPIAVTTIKAALVNGKATKAEMVDAVEKKYYPKLREIYGEKKAEDVADAFGIACWIARNIYQKEMEPCRC